jgi:hypothetical protein
MLFDVKAWTDRPSHELDTAKVQQIICEVDAEKLKRDLFSSDKIVVEKPVKLDLGLLVDRHLSKIIPREIIRSSLQESRVVFGETALVYKERFCELMSAYTVALDIMEEQDARHLAIVVAATYGTTAAEGFQLHRWMRTDIEAKYWVSSRDEKVRYSHSAADGLEVDLRAPFKFSGERMRYPGDPRGSFDNVVGCRCSMLPRRRG